MNANRGLEELYARRTFGIKPGLDRTRALLKELGNPHLRIPAVHVAGTNGKGSVSVMISSILHAAGMCVGMYTSPHLVQLNERFMINGKCIDDDEMFGLLSEVNAAADIVCGKGGGNATFFEIVTALAFLWFARQKVDIAVVETGMGGRLDATNVLPSPVVSVLTKIGMDHAEYLGNTLSEIAAEKAGIIKRGRPVVAGAMPLEAFRTVSSAAAAAGSALIYAPDAVGVRRISGDTFAQRVSIETSSECYGTVNMRMAASYQLENIATAVAAVENVFSCVGADAPAAAVRSGLAAAEWPGRFIHTSTGELADGAHNPDGAAAFVKALKDAGLKKKLIFVVGMCADKDISGFMRTIAPVCGKLFSVPIRNTRSSKPVFLASLAHSCGIDATPCDSLEEALNMAHQASEPDVPPIVCGSLFLVGELLERGNKK